MLPDSLIERVLCWRSVARDELRSHIVELSVRLARLAGGSAISLSHVYVLLDSRSLDPKDLNLWFYDPKGG